MPERSQLRELAHRRIAPSQGGTGTQHGASGVADSGVAGSGAAGAGPTQEHARCDMCAEPLADSHRHVLEISSGAISCVCPACGILFDHDGAGGGNYRLIRTRPRRLDDLEFDDVLVASLGIPVDLAFVVRGSSGGVSAFYPNPVGTMRADIAPETWHEIEVSHPVLARMVSDVEALTIHRIGDTRQYWLLPVDECYRLAALVRTQWRGFNGGTRVWQEVERFFADLSCG